MRIEVQQWQRAEIFLRSAKQYAHPDTDVALAAVFTGPAGQQLTLPGFWYGGDRWCVRFAPPTTGRWSYLITATDLENAGLHAAAGEIDAVAYSGSLPIYRHGFVRVADDRRGFVYDDGTPFLWLGNTHWQAPDYERLTECNDPRAPGCRSQFRASVEHDVSRGFTVYQTYPDAGQNDGGGNLAQVAWWSQPYQHLNPRGFAEQFDVMMNYLADRGLVIALGVGVHWRSGQLGAEALTHFTRYLVARYAAYPVVWITGQEVDVENELGTLPVWREVAATIAQADGYHHPLGAHMDSVGEPKTFGEEPWHDWFPTQGGHDGVRTQAHYRSYWDQVPTKPFVETEANYEGIWTVPASGPRHAAWTSILCGSRGYTFGTAGVWAIKWDYDVPGWDDYQNGTPWFNGVRTPGGAQMTLLRQFLDALPAWHRLIPRFGDPAYGWFAHPEESVLATDGNEVYLAYFRAPTLASGTLTGLDPHRRYTAVWFDPRAGDRVLIDTAIVAPAGEWTIPLKPSTEDWVLHVQAQ